MKGLDLASAARLLEFVTEGVTCAPLRSGIVRGHGFWAEYLATLAAQRAGAFARLVLIELDNGGAQALNVTFTRSQEDLKEEAPSTAISEQGGAIGAGTASGGASLASGGGRPKGELKKQSLKDRISEEEREARLPLT